MHQKYTRNALAPRRRSRFNRPAIALAVLGLCTGMAHAQSSVVLYGSLDGGLRNLVNGTRAGGAALSMASNGTYNSNRWGFIGTEDLGGGMSANFNLEAGYVLSTGANNNSNGIEFQRTATVGLGGAWGNVDVGHQFTLQHYLIKDFEPFDFKYLAITEATLITDGNTGRDDNDIYYHGKFGPFVARAEYAVGGVAGSFNDGSTRALGVNYVTGPVKLGVGYTHKSQQIVSGVGPFLGNNQYTAGGAYSIGDFTAMIGWATNLQNTPAGSRSLTRNTYLWGGARYRVNTQIELTAAYYDNKNVTAGVDGSKSVSILGATYALSKRTNFYADVDYTKFHGGEITNLILNPSGRPSQTGVSFGINHWF